MSDNGDNSDDLRSRMNRMLLEQYGRKNVEIVGERTTIRCYPVEVNFYNWKYSSVVHVFMRGEGHYLNFPVDGSMYTLEMLAQYTDVSPGSYVNSAKTLYCPCYSFVFRSRDLDNPDFILNVVDRLVEMSKNNSDMFDESLEKEGKKIDDFSDLDLLLDDLTWELDDDSGSSGVDEGS